MLSKSYSLLNFLNRSHSPVFRYGIGGAAYAGTLAVTGRHSIAQLVRVQFRDDETKYGFRLAGWVLRRGWPGLETVTDDFFDFTLGAQPADLEALEAFIAHRRGSLPEHLWRADDLFVRAARIHAQLDAGVTDIQDLRADFRAHANDLLPLISSAQGRPAAQGPDRAGDFSVEDARSALEDLASALPVEQWRWYVISGTFLGLVREGGFLAHDYDIDVGFTYDPDDPGAVLALVEAMKASPHFVVKKLDDAQAVVETAPGRHTVSRDPALVKLIHANGINVDVFIHHRVGDRLWHGSSIHRWENSSFELAPYVLAGVPVLGPADADRYLTENYGDWRTPVTDFNCTTGTPNLVISRSFRSVALFLTRLAHFAHGDPVEYTKLRATLVADGMLRDVDGVLQLERDV
jgi:AcrR family transcriptional regulator